MSTSTAALVLLERVGAHVALVTINRSQSRNAISAAVAQALGRIVKTVEQDPSIRAAVITGAGQQAFCAGADLKEMAAGSDRHARATPDGGFAGFVFAPRTKPWIAAVNGAALAGGFEIVLACDLVVASRAAMFGLPEVKRGLAAAAGGIHRLPRTVPRNIALELIVTGEPIGAERAYALGLVNRLADPDRVVDEALALAATIGANAPLAVRGSLEVARRAQDADEAELRRHAGQMMEQLFLSADAREGPRAFAEKRPPRWSAG